MRKMAHSKTMNQKRRDDMVRSVGNGGRHTMDKSHKDYTRDKREGGPFGK